MYSAIQNFAGQARRRGLFGVLVLYILGAWAVLQVAALAFPGWGIPDHAIRHVWTGAFLLFPIAIIFGWRYDISSRGLRRSTAADNVELTTPDYCLVTALAALSAAALYFATTQVLATRIDSRSVETALDAPEHSIAVLPFVNMSDDVNNEYFSDGMSEQLLNELARIPSLQVAARTSAFYYKNRNENIEKIGAELGVHYVLEGSVRKATDTIRVTAQLIDATNGYHLWSETYDRNLNDVLRVQDDIASAIAEALEIRVLAQNRLRDTDLGPRGAEAIDLFLRGLSSAQSGDGDSYLHAIENYRAAIELAPEFAAAHKETAYSYLMLPFRNKMSFDSAITAAEPYIARALELAPDSADVIATLALSRNIAKDYEEANRNFEKAISINPNLFAAQMHYGLSLVYQGRLKEASTAYIQAQALDPMNATLNANLGALFFLMGRFDEGLRFSDKSLSIDPGYAPAKNRLPYWLSNYGRLADSVASSLALIDDSPENIQALHALSRTYVRLGMNDEGRAVLDLLMRTGADDFPKGTAADYLYLATTDVDGYTEFAEKTFQSVKAAPGAKLNFTDAMRTHWYGRSLLLQGRYDEAADMFWWAAGGDEGIDSITYDQVYLTKFLALAWQHTGRQSDAAQVLDRAHDLVTTARDNGWGTPFLYLRLAEIEAINGDVGEAMQNIGIAVDRGYRDLPWMKNSPFFHDLQDHPEMLRLMETVRIDVAAERAKLELVVTESG